ncbi:putative adenylyltransferase/sulfurtransferase MoeZ [compost metagenome]
MANEAIKIICGFGEILSGQLLVFNALNNEMQCFNFAVPTIKQPSKIKEIDLPTNTMDISLMELQQWKSQKKDFTLIDVRETYEFEENNIGGINIPLYELNNRLDEISLHKGIVFCCSSGKRSKIAIQLLKNITNTELYSVILK